MGARWLSLQLRPRPRPLGLGLSVALAFVVAETLVLYPLEQLAAETALVVVYLLGVVVVAIGWGFWLAAATSLASALAFDYFHVPPVYSFIPTRTEDAVGLAVFLVVALSVSTLADLARSRAAEADQRRREADLAAELARLMLYTRDLGSALDQAAKRLAQVLGLAFSELKLEAVSPDERHSAIPLRDGATQIGTLLVPTDLSEGKVHSWNVAFQRQLPWRFTGEIAYVGNRGRGVLGRLELNAGLIPGADNAGRPAFAPYGRTASSTGWSKTNTQYDSMQVKLDRRYSNGLLWTNSYTLSRAKDYVNDNGTIGTPADVSLSYGPADFDRTHNFVSSFVYELPFARGASGAMGAILGGWQVAGVFVAQSGTPVDIRAAGASLRAPQNQQRPNLNGDQTVLGNIGPGQQYFDTSVYSAPAANTFGNMARNAGPRGPGYFNLDMSIMKRVKVNGRVAVELRADAFNATNTPHFANPGRDFGTPTFGQVTGTLGTDLGGSGPRLVRFGARVIF